MESRSRIGVFLILMSLLACGGLLAWFLSTQPLIPTIPEPVGTIGAYLNPTPTIRPSPVTIIRQVRNLSRLETASYSVEKVITAESGQDALAFLFGDRLLLIAHGEVIAGVNLEQVGEGDITVTEDDRVVFVLPPSEILVVTLDNDKTYVYDRDTGLFGMNPGLETAARQAAEEEILQAALEDGILEMADANARAYLTQLITAFGFQDVIFIPATPSPPPPTIPITVVPITPTP